MSSKPRTEELLAAYASGAELSAEERASVEALLAGSPAARGEVDAIAGVLGALRETEPEPPPASEAVVRAVRIACAAPEPWPARVRGWLRRRWPVIVPLALAAGVIAVVAIVRSVDAPRAMVAKNPAPAPVPLPGPVPVPAPAPDSDEVAVWLDGQATDLGSLDSATADELDRELGDELAALSGDFDDDVGGDTDTLLPDDDLDWVDDLDDSAADALDQWLAEQPS